MEKVYESGIYHYGKRAAIYVFKSQLADVSRNIQNEFSHLWNDATSGGSMGAEKITLEMIGPLIFTLLCAFVACQLSLLIELRVATFSNGQHQ